MNSSVKRHLIKVEDFTKKEYVKMFRFAKEIEKGKDVSSLCKCKVLATLFFQESTRTINAFKAAMIRLGGGTIRLEGVTGTYLRVGEEDKEDTIRQFAMLSDVMVIRDQDPATLKIAQKVSGVPIINGGSGTEEHACAGLYGGYLLYHKFGKIDGLKVCLYGAPGPSRTAKAYLKFLSMFKTEIYVDIVLPELDLPKETYEFAEKQGNKIKRVMLDDVIDTIDLLIIEGIPVKFVDKKIVPVYLKAFKPITLKQVSRMKKNSLVNVIEPRIVDKGLLSMTKEVDNDPRSVLPYHTKVWTYAVMALMIKLLKTDKNRRK